MTTPLAKDWCTVTVIAGVDTGKPGIYEWIIAGAGSYIGKYTSIRRPTREYALNVERLLNGRPYRKGDAEGYRRIHHELAWACHDGRRIDLVILENVDPDNINAREGQLREERGTLNGKRLDHRKFRPQGK